MYYNLINREYQIEINKRWIRYYLDSVVESKKSPFVITTQQENRDEDIMNEGSIQSQISFQEELCNLLKISKDKPGVVIQIGFFPDELSKEFALLCQQQEREYHIINPDKKFITHVKALFTGLHLDRLTSFFCQDFYNYACEPDNYREKIFFVLIDGYRIYDEVIKDCVTLRIMAERIDYAVFSHFYSRHISLDVRTDDAVSKILGADIPLFYLYCHPMTKPDTIEQWGNDSQNTFKKMNFVDSNGVLLDFSKMKPYPKKKLYLHIGIDKCGSTTIQTFLAKNRESLKKFGYVYPGNNINHVPGANQSKINSEIFGYSDNLPFFRDYIYEALVTESTRCILSAENFINDPHISHRFFPCKLFFDCKIVIYIRNIVLHTESRFQQIAVTPSHYFFKDVLYLHNYYSISHFLKQINNWISFFGREVISIHDFDLIVKNNDLISDFLYWAELSHTSSSFIQLPPQNISLQYKYLHFLLHCYLLPLTNSQRGKLIHSLKILSYEDEYHERYLFIPKQFYEELLTRSSKECIIIGNMLNNPDWISYSYENLNNLKQAPINLKSELQHEIFQKLPPSLKQEICEIWPNARTKNLNEPLLPCMPINDDFAHIIHSWGKELWIVNQDNELTPSQSSIKIRRLVMANNTISNKLKEQENLFNDLLEKHRLLNKKIRQTGIIPFSKCVIDMLVILSDIIELKKETTIISKSVYFDCKWYQEQYPDVSSSKISPIMHYCKYGWIEGRNPGPLFNTNNYLKRYQDVDSAGVNPLVHFELFGRKEGRRTE